MLVGPEVVVIVTTNLELLRRVLRDERSGRVVFVSHCLLNPNVRYLGGATCPGATDQVVAGLLHTGVGLVQMPCPEQYGWGGVCKRYTVPAYGADRTILRRVRRPATRLFLIYTRLAYHRLARRVAAQIADYLRSGQTVESVVGIGGSPSCGVYTTLDLPAFLDDIAGRDPAQLNRREFNQHVIARHARAGQGMFIAALRRHLRRRAIDVPFAEHDLIAEITQPTPDPNGSSREPPQTGPGRRSQRRVIRSWQRRLTLVPGSVAGTGPGRCARPVCRAGSGSARKLTGPPCRCATVARCRPAWRWPSQPSVRPSVRRVHAVDGYSGPSGGRTGCGRWS